MRLEAVIFSTQNHGVSVCLFVNVKNNCLYIYRNIISVIEWQQRMFAGQRVTFLQPVSKGVGGVENQFLLPIIFDRIRYEKF